MLSLLLFWGGYTLLAKEDRYVKPDSHLYEPMLNGMKALRIKPLSVKQLNEINSSLKRKRIVQKSTDSNPLKLIEIKEQKKRFEVIAIIGNAETFLIKDRIENKVIRIKKGEAVDLDPLNLSWSDTGELRIIDQFGNDHVFNPNDAKARNTLFEAVVKDSDDEVRSYRRGESIQTKDGLLKIIEILPWKMKLEQDDLEVRIWELIKGEK